MSPPGIDFGVLCDELGTLIHAPPARDDAARAHVERTLTDGYAHAMALEGDRLRLERQIADVAAQADTRDPRVKTIELQDLSARLTETSGDLKHLRGLLAALRRRTSAAA